MMTALGNSDYTATHVGLKMRFFYQKEFQCQLEVRTIGDAKTILAAWARLKLASAQIQEYHVLTKHYVGATIDDVSVDSDGKYLINGKLVDAI